MVTGPHPTAGEVSRLIGAARLEPYLDAAGRDLDFALGLYHWNLQVGSALQEVLGFVEISVRNAIDARLRIWNPTRGYDPSAGVAFSAEWTTLPAAPLRGQVRDALKQARSQAARARSERSSSHPRKNAPISHDDVVAQLSFSLWPKLVAVRSSKAASPTLWSAALVDAFPYAAGNSVNQLLTVSGQQLVHDRLTRLVGLRNRVAHMEPLLEVNVAARLTDCLQLLSYISPPARDWCAGISRVTNVNNARPHN